MGKPSEQWYAIDHVVEDSEDNVFGVRSKATAAASRSSAGGGSTANGSTGGASRLWTSARRPALEIVRGGEGGSNETTRSIDAVKVSCFLHSQLQPLPSSIFTLFGALRHA